MKKIFTAALISIMALTGFMFTGCKEKTDAINGKWETSVLIKEGEEKPVVPSHIEFHVSGKKADVNGDAGVNLFNGKIKLEKNSFKASDEFAVTKMMGDPASIEFEDMFLEALMTADSFTLEGNKLTVKDSSGKYELQFTKAE